MVTGFSRRDLLVVAKCDAFRSATPGASSRSGHPPNFHQLRLSTRHALPILVPIYVFVFVDNKTPVTVQVRACRVIMPCRSHHSSCGTNRWNLHHTRASAGGCQASSGHVPQPVLMNGRLIFVLYTSYLTEQAYVKSKSYFLLPPIKIGRQITQFMSRL